MGCHALVHTGLLCGNFLLVERECNGTICMNWGSSTLIGAMLDGCASKLSSVRAALCATFQTEKGGPRLEAWGRATGLAAMHPSMGVR